MKIEVTLPLYYTANDRTPPEKVFVVLGSSTEGDPVAEAIPFDASAFTTIVDGSARSIKTALTEDAGK